MNEPITPICPARALRENAFTEIFSHISSTAALYSRFASVEQRKAGDAVQVFLRENKAEMHRRAVE